MNHQRSKGWFDERIGRFTASEIHKLMGKQGLGLTGETYAIERAIESCFGKVEENFTSYDMQRGIDLEPLAFEKFRYLKDLDFIEVKEALFFPYGEHAGASPDGIVGNDGVFENKCPRPKKFFKLVADGKVDSEYEWQVQKQMLASNSEKAFFFNYIILDGKEYWHEIIIYRDESKIDLIKSRLDIAIEIKLNYIEKLRNNIQCL